MSKLPGSDYLRNRYGKDLNVVLIGKPFAYKGVFSSYLVERFGINDSEHGTKNGFHHVSVGDEITKEIKRSRTFAEKNSEEVRGGVLISDAEAHRLAMCRLSEGRGQGYRRFCIEGHCRKPSQVDLLVQEGILGEHSLCFILEVSDKSCFERLEYALTHGTRKHRLDNDKLADRLQTYKDHIEGVIEALVKNHIDFEHIDAEGDSNSFKEKAIRFVTRVCPLPKTAPVEQSQEPRESFWNQIPNLAT